MGILSDLADFFTGTKNTDTEFEQQSKALTGTARESQELTQEKSTAETTTAAEATTAKSSTLDTSLETVGQQLTTGTKELFSAEDRSYLSALLGTAANFTDANIDQTFGDTVAQSLFRSSEAIPGVAQQAGLAAEDVARLEFQRVAVPELVRAGQRLGSSQNTAIDQLTARADEDLAIRLAGIRSDALLQGAELQLKGEGLAADAAQRAAQSRIESFKPIIDTLSLARGATEVSTEARDTSETQTGAQVGQDLTTVDTFEQSVKNSESEKLAAELSTLLGFEEKEASGTGETSTGSSLLDWLTAIGSLPD